MTEAEETISLEINDSVEEKGTDEAQKMSKRQLKLQAKRQRWLESKPLRKEKEKRKRKLKIQRAKEAGIDLGPSRKLLKSLKMSDSSCKIKVCFDLSFTELMTSAEFSKTFKQLHRCYSINRRATAPLQLYITGFDDNAKNAMANMSGCFNWDVNFDQRFYSELFDKSSIIYLSSDSPNIIETLDESKVYIIGALVDHNRLKNICYDKAVKDCVGHARLPLDTYFKFKTRTVLTIDQVYSIILRVTEGNSWIDAVIDTVPKRKGIKLRDNSDSKINEEAGDLPLSNSSEENVEESNKHSQEEKSKEESEEPYMTTDLSSSIIPSNS